MPAYLKLYNFKHFYHRLFKFALDAVDFVLYNRRKQLLRAFLIISVDTLVYDIAPKAGDAKNPAQLALAG